MAKSSRQHLNPDDEQPQPTDAAAAEAPESMPPQTIEIRIPADAEWVRVVRLGVVGVASRLKFFHDDIEDIKLAVSEACNNAILHAAAPRDGVRLPLIIIHLTPHEDRLEISVADEGCFDDGGLPKTSIRLVSPHQESHSELPESGLGLFLMQALMDSVVHHAGPHRNTIIRMVKYVRTPSGD